MVALPSGKATSCVIVQNCNKRAGRDRGFLRNCDEKRQIVKRVLTIGKTRDIMKPQLNVGCFRLDPI